LPEVVAEGDLEAGHREADHRELAQGLKAANEAAVADREIVDFQTTKRCST
jgi:hypothetical protein